MTPGSRRCNEAGKRLALQRRLGPKSLRKLSPEIQEMEWMVLGGEAEGRRGGKEAGWGLILGRGAESETDPGAQHLPPESGSDQTQAGTLAFCSWTSSSGVSVPQAARWKHHVHFISSSFVILVCG